MTAYGVPAEGLAGVIEVLFVPVGATFNHHSPIPSGL